MVIVAVLMGLAGWAVVASFDFGPVLEVILPFFVALGYIAVAIARGRWTPRWLAQLADRNDDLAWLTPRLLLMAIAIVTIVMASSHEPPFPTCPDRGGYFGGSLHYATVNGDTLVCTYTGGGGL